MAYIIESLPAKNNSEIPYGIRLTSNYGLFTTVYDINEQTKENLKTLLLTSVGERYMLPTFGCNLISVLFQPNIDELKVQITDIIMSAINTWLPYVNVLEITVDAGGETSSQENATTVKLSYSVSNFETTSITITATDNNTVTVV
jgi:phage baseplate assembly protein W